MNCVSVPPQDIILRSLNDNHGRLTSKHSCNQR